MLARLVSIALAVLPPLASAEARAPVVPAAPAATSAARLDLRDLLEATRTGLVPTERALALAGTRVTLAGFMAEMEEPPSGGYWLVPRPVHCDEGGAGTGDLPPDAVRVVVRARAGFQVQHVEGPIVATGILEVGPQADEDGQVSAFRLLVESTPPASPHPSPQPSHQSKERK